MREMLLPESGPKRKLLDAAELLFADKGFEAVSVRDITQSANMNVASVNYHFGSRENLVIWVTQRYAGPIHEERVTRLESAERKWLGKGLPVEEIIDAYVRPLLGQARRTALPERKYHQLLGRIFAANGDGLASGVEEQLRQVNDRFIRSFGKALGGIPAEEVAARVHFMTGSVIYCLTHHDLLAGSAPNRPGMEASLARVIRFAAAGLRDGAEVEVAAPKGPQAVFDF